MNERLKRILLILGFIGIVILFGFLIWTFLFRGGPLISPEPDDPETSGPGVLPPGQEGSPTVIPGEDDDDDEVGGVLDPSDVADGGVTFVTQLTSSGITSPNITGNDVAYYDSGDGRFYTIGEDGSVLELSNTVFPGAENVVISNDASAAAIEFPDGSNIIYDFQTESQTTLPNHWEEFDFSPNSEEVATKSIGIDPNNNLLVVTSADGSRTDVIAGLGTNADRVDVNWSPNNQIIGFSRTGDTVTGFGRSEIYLIGADGDEKGAIIVEGGNFSPLWNPSGSHILYSVADAGNNNRPSLWYTNVTGDVGTERKKIPLETWAEKCTFADATIVYCAVPREVVRESGIDHSLVQESDDVYQVNVQTGRVELLATPAINMQMFDLFVSADGTTLYFTDAAGRLNSMKLQ